MEILCMSVIYILNLFKMQCCLKSSHTTIEVSTQSCHCSLLLASISLFKFMLYGGSVFLSVWVGLKGTVVGDCHFVNMSGSHHWSQAISVSVCQLMVLSAWSVDTDWPV